jgi:uncharacterized membrane protein YsdA (DUF1294 family)
MGSVSKKPVRPRSGAGNRAVRRKRPAFYASVCVAAGFFGAITFAAFSGLIPFFVLAVYAVASVIAYSAYKADKESAIAKQWRTRESFLHLLELLGGWPGALVAQWQFRHKNRKAAYQFTFWCIVAINVGALGWAGTQVGQWKSGSLAWMFRPARTSNAPRYGTWDLPPTRTPIQTPPRSASAPITIKASDFPRAGDKENQGIVISVKPPASAGGRSLPK